MNETEFPPIEHATTEHYIKEVSKDKEAIFIDVKSEEQVNDSGCGPAVVADVLKTLGIEVSQQTLIQEAEVRIAGLEQNTKGFKMEDLGMPPEILQYLLETHGVDFEIKESVGEITDESCKEARAYLDEKLKEGCVVICPVQTIPDYGKDRDIDADGHYLIVCGKTAINGHDYYTVIDPMFHYYQRLSNENSLYRVHMGKAAPEDTRKIQPEIEYYIADPNNPKSEIISREAMDTDESEGDDETADSDETEEELAYTETRDLPYTQEQLKSFGIDPKTYGIRFVSAEQFVKRWEDVSGFGEKYNQYGIAVKITQGNAQTEDNKTEGQL